MLNLDGLSDYPNVCRGDLPSAAAERDFVREFSQQLAEFLYPSFSKNMNLCSNTHTHNWYVCASLNFNAFWINSSLVVQEWLKLLLLSLWQKFPTNFFTCSSRNALLWKIHSLEYTPKASRLFSSTLVTVVLHRISEKSSPVIHQPSKCGAKAGA